MLSFIKNGASIFLRRQEDILSAAFIIAFSVALSRILGLVRLRLLAANFGDDLRLLDSYFAAQLLPDAIFEVLIFGTISLAFIPVFAQFLSKDKIQRAWELSSSMISLGLVIFVIFTVVLMALADFVAPIIAPGVVNKDPTTQVIIARLLRIMLIAQLFFVVSIFLTGILQSFQRFLVPAMASIFYNVGIIVSIVFLSDAMGIYAPAFGMILGALLHLVIQLPLALSLGFKFKFNLNFKNKDVRETLHLMWPRSLALGLTRISDLVNIILASIASVGSIVALNFALVIQLAPISLFAASISQAALPSLSLEFNFRGKERFKELFLQSFHQILFLILPAAAIIAILRIPIVRLVFGAKEFPWDITVLTGRTLIAFAVGIAAQAISLLLTRSFHAIKDSFTPLKLNMITVGVNISLSLFFILVLKLSIIYIALSYSIANILNATLLFWILDKRINFDKKKLLLPALKMLLISLIMAVSLYVPMKLLDQLVFDTTRTVGLILLTGIATFSGLFVYIFLSWVLGVREIKIFAHFSRRLLSFPKRFMMPTASSIDAQEQNP